MMQALLIAILVVSGLLTVLGRRAARRLGLPEGSGIGIALAVMAIGAMLAPGHWREQLLADGAIERSLVFAREIGLTGLLFLAGARLDVRKAWQQLRVSSAVAAAGLLLMAVVAALLSVYGEQDRYAIIATSAAIAAASLWLPGEIPFGIKESHQSAIESAKGAAVILTGLLLLVVHLSSVFHDVAWRAGTSAAYGIVGLYELLKIALFFALACFVVSRFLALAEGRISTVRMMIGYLLMAVLIFVLATSVIGPLGALAWSFVAGVLLARSETGKQLSRNAPIATAMFLPLAFLPLFLQSHGRGVGSFSHVALVVAGIAIGKLGMGWLAARMAGASKRDAKLIASSALASGEAAVIFLGFAMTRFVIESAEYFIVLSFALVSMIAGSVIWWVLSHDKESYESGAPSLSPKADKAGKSRQPKGEKKHNPTRKASLAGFAIAMALSAFGPTAFAQSRPTTDEDPVSRAMKSVEAVADERAKAAEVVMAASKLVNESAAAKKRGDHERAKEALREAEKIAAEADEFDRSALIDELARIVTSEQAALNPRKDQSAGQFPPDNSIKVAVPRSAMARMDSYRDSFVQILEEEGVPIGLLGVALVESGFNPLALSPKGARGIWQFMPATAERYGLSVGPGGDHRTHPEHSTRAAARYLRDLYEMFGDWKLALAAYNAGEGRVQRIIKQTGIRGFEEMSRRGLLPLETRKYVPAVLAAWSRVGGSSATTQSGAARSERAARRNNAQVVQALTKPGESDPTPAGAKR